MLSDLRQALRQLLKTPGFTFTALVTLALGIGATTAIFTLVQQVMLKSLPVVNPQELYRIGDKIHCCNWGGYTQDGEFSLFSWELYKHFRDNTPAFEQLAALQGGNAPLGVRRAGTSQQAETRNGEYVSGNFFETVGVGAWIGRVLTPSDDHEGAAPVVVMSYHVWKEKYGGDPSVVGAVYQVNGHPFTVVGVAAPGFYGARLAGWAMPDFWLPLTAEVLLDGATQRLKSPDQHFLDIIGRVKPGTNSKTLEAQLRGELHDWQASHLADMGPQEKEIWQKQTLHLTPGGAGVNDMRDQYADGLKLLLAAAGCVLLVACANIANLLLARGLKNRQQMSVRLALGSGRRRLVQMALVESVTLGVLGGLAGIGVAFAGTSMILHMAFQASTADNYVPVQATPSWPVLLFTLGISVLTGVVFGIAPAWITSHAQPVEALRGARSSTGSRTRWLQKTLVIAQAAMSLVLLSAAAMLGQSLRNLQHQNFGFETQGRYLASINPMLGGYKREQLEPLFRRIQERLSAIPGVRSVSSALYAPMSGDSWNTGVRVEGKPEPPAKEDSSASWTRVTPGFFDTIGNRMVMGRPITEEDSATTRNVAVINEAFAKRFFKGENPIGRHFGPDQTKYSGMFEVVGVDSDMRYLTYGMKDPDRPMFFLAQAQSTHFDKPSENAGELWSHYLYNIVLWAPGNPPGLDAQVRKALGEIDPNLVLYSVDSYAHVLGADFAQQNMIATLTLLFGALGLVLAAVGLYGVTAYTVEQRTNEIGVRMALGADRKNVVSMILRGAFWQVGVGLALGIPAAVGAGWAITTQLFGVKFWDPAMLFTAAVLLALAALAAALIPARRAASLDPMQALRTE
jgi:putative ABC transport system permease protein